MNPRHPGSEQSAKWMMRTSVYAFLTFVFSLGIKFGELYYNENLRLTFECLVTTLIILNFKFQNTFVKMSRNGREIKYDAS